MINRRDFIRRSGLAAVLSATTPWGGSSLRAASERQADRRGRHELKGDLIVVGGGLGGCAAALAALRSGLKVIWTEETDWIGGQLTQQAVPPDEHRWIESHGCTESYRRLRDGIRAFYRDHYPLTAAAEADPRLNPGKGSVSRLCHEPRVALAVLEGFFLPYLSNRQLILRLEHAPVKAEVDGNRVRALAVQDLRGGGETWLEAPYFIDATELGDLLPLTGAEFVMGAEGKAKTSELHTPEEANPANQQACTVCFAMDYLAGENWVIDEPEEYSFWREYVPRLKPPWPGKLLDWTYTHPSSSKPRLLGFDPAGEGHEGALNLWVYRRILGKGNFQSGFYQSDISLVNWPQNDYFLSPLTTANREERDSQIRRAKQLSLSLLYWMQTEAPRARGKQGFPELRLRSDIVGTEDGLAKFPYVRESRRIEAMFTVLEEHVGRENRAMVTGEKASEVKAAVFHDSVGIGSYHIDLHPSTGGDNYIDFPSLPFQIPMGSLIPRRMENLLPAAKNIGTTHITNGCYRLHPVEWNIGEAAGFLAAFCLRHKLIPKQVRGREPRLHDFQRELRRVGIPLQWPA